MSKIADPTVVDSFMVGDVRITRLEETTMIFPPHGLLSGDRKELRQKTTETKWLHPYFVTPDGKIKLVIQMFVIETPDGQRICIDTCVGNHKVQFPNFAHLLVLVPPMFC